MTRLFWKIIFSHIRILFEKLFPRASNNKYNCNMEINVNPAGYPGPPELPGEPHQEYIISNLDKLDYKGTPRQETACLRPNKNSVRDSVPDSDARSNISLKTLSHLSNSSGHKIYMPIQNNFHPAICSSKMVYGRFHSRVVCEHCDLEIETVVEHRYNLITYLSCVLTFILCGGCALGLIPMMGLKTSDPYIQKVAVAVVESGSSTAGSKSITKIDPAIATMPVTTTTHLPTTKTVPLTQPTNWTNDLYDTWTFEDVKGSLNIFGILILLFTIVIMLVSSAVPFFINGCKTAVHRCGNCSRKLGEAGVCGVY